MRLLMVWVGLLVGSWAVVLGLGWIVYRLVL